MTTNTQKIKKTEKPACAENIKILLVEDDGEFRQSLADYLRLRGMNVSEAASGREFLAALSLGWYDIALLDVNLPDVSGYDLLGHLKAHGSIGAIMLTACKERGDRLRGYGAGADLYFTKPVDSEELALAIGNLARRMRDLMPQTVLETDMRSTAHGILRLERTRRMLHGPNGTSVSLSGREVALLEYLAAHPYLTISREEIAHVFGDADAHPESRALDAAISRMRIKLRAEGMDMPFHTIKGAGLRMTEAIAVE